MELASQGRRWYCGAKYECPDWVAKSSYGELATRKTRVLRRTILGRKELIREGPGRPGPVQAGHLGPIDRYSGPSGRQDS